jgi:hypothetical protein
MIQRLHDILINRACSKDDTLQVILNDPEALRKGDSNGRLPLHIECKNQCRAAIISKCIELYPESLKMDENTHHYLPLHIAIANVSSSVDTILSMIDKFPDALKHQDSYGNLPIHIECKNQRRSSILKKCIDLYPQSIAMASKINNNSLPLHILLSNQTSSIGAALMMIEKYPAALRHQNGLGYFPLYIECNFQCRPVILSRCIELYPQALAKADERKCLPLHIILSRHRSSLDIALVMIKKCPESLRQAYEYQRLPLHLECIYQCRPSIISKCIELCPESVYQPDLYDDIPWTLALKAKLDRTDNISELCKSLYALLSAYPSSFYYPPHDPLVDQLAIRRGHRYRRMLLNLLPSCLSSSYHVQGYHDLNWEPRCSLLHLWLQIRLKSRQMRATSLEQLLSITTPSAELRIKDGSMRLLMMKMLEQSSLLGLEAVGQDFCLYLGDGIGDLILRFVIAYL